LPACYKRSRLKLAPAGGGMNELRRSGARRRTGQSSRGKQAPYQLGCGDPDEGSEAAPPTAAKLRRPPDERLPGTPVKGGGRK
jgi:hypothetical protein